jgi:sulfoxide reductase heme-binding subunit YedZ
VLITSLLRTRVGASNWRAVHWLAYACWPLAIFHGLGTGSDVRQTWMLLLDAICVLVVIFAVWVRVRTAEYVTAWSRALAVGLPALFLLVLAVWLPGGPLAPGWARRSGTPVKLIAGARTAPATSGTGRP